ncbi:hypothetical protein TTRE_0000851301 [Trichuris trichiura]|uniref:Uncharacterized protein n=1 Tax=Trichuris trichiura TaxID=36087 RepID=A0A077ZIF7_TRITR|nr:hypothetical protein TTRE_0000851301 [Trichuris trichiura]
MENSTLYNASGIGGMAIDAEKFHELFRHNTTAPFVITDPVREECTLDDYKLAFICMFVAMHMILSCMIVRLNSRRVDWPYAIYGPDLMPDDCSSRFVASLLDDIRHSISQPKHKSLNAKKRRIRRRWQRTLANRLLAQKKKKGSLHEKGKTTSSGTHPIRKFLKSSRKTKVLPKEKSKTTTSVTVVSEQTDSSSSKALQRRSSGRRLCQERKAKGTHRLNRI